MIERVQAELPPRACVCGRANGPFVDTGHERIYDGGPERIYLCVACVVEVMQVADAVSMTRYRAACDELAGQQRRVVELEAMKAEWDGVRQEKSDVEDRLAEERSQRMSLERSLAELRAKPDVPLRELVRPRSQVAEALEGDR